MLMGEVELEKKQSRWKRGFEKAHGDKNVTKAGAPKDFNTFF